MKQLLSALTLATLAASAGAQVTFAGGTDTLISGIYNPSGTTSPQTGGRLNSLLSSTGGTLTATFLGFEALDTDTFTFSIANSTLNNKTAVADVTTIFGPVAPGALNFTFADLFTGTVVGNGGGGSGVGMFTSYLVFGTGTGAAFVPYTKGGLYDVVLGFNDGMQVDADFDDLIVGLKVAAVPESETYALLLAGLGVVGFVARRRQRSGQA
jgi:hypothetical protein